MNTKFNESFQQYIYTLGNRFNSIAMAFNWYLDNKGKIIVETGTSRLIGNLTGDGCFTILAAQIATASNTHLWTCDILKDHIDAAKYMTRQDRENVTYVVNDSVEFLKNFDKTIDLLYLDSMDFVIGGNNDKSQDHCLNEYLAARYKLSEKAIVVIDDCGVENGGKGGKAIPQMLQDGWIKIYDSYQVVLVRSSSW